VSSIRSVICGCGSYLPEKVLTNADLARIVDTTDEWIVERSGIHQRHVAAEGELTSDLAIAAARRALENGGFDASDIDLIILATSTPDQTFPASAVSVQAGLGITHGAAFDIQAVCSGFVYAMATADSFVKSGQCRRVLVIGAETFSRILDWTDRTTCVLFGDGAGAVVVEGRASEKAGNRGILGSVLRSDGRYKDLLYVDGGPSTSKQVGHIKMQGKEVFRFAVGAIAEVIEEALRRHDLTSDDIDWFIPHQANKRILDGTARKLSISPDKIVMTLAKHGNTSAASIPLAIDTARQDGRLKQGDLVLLEAMGGGFTWGSVLLRW
jgi:3-oxoacyl-[acyl-carrier-protein] synthase-3